MILSSLLRWDDARSALTLKLRRLHKLSSVKMFRNWQKFHFSIHSTASWEWRKFPIEIVQKSNEAQNFIKAFRISFSFSCCEWNANLTTFFALHFSEIIDQRFSLSTYSTICISINFKLGFWHCFSPEVLWGNFLQSNFKQSRNFSSSTHDSTTSLSKNQLSW